jgi:hypothetical protein
VRGGRCAGPRLRAARGANWLGCKALRIRDRQGAAAGDAGHRSHGACRDRIGDLRLRYGFGLVDAKPLRSPQPAANCVAGYLAKYLVKRGDDGSFGVSETVQAAGRTLLSYVSRRLTARSLCTMRMLRLVRVAWAWRGGLIEAPQGDPFEFLVAVCEQAPLRVWAP